MIFLTGGARSGKSSVAVDMARRHKGPVRYIATGLPSDEEMERRIETHRRNRPGHWAVVEAPVKLSEAIAGSDGGDLLVVDCVTLWISNLMVDHDDEVILNMVDEAISALSEREPPPVVVVSNEVGSGLVPMDPVGRRFRDLQGVANQRFAAASEKALLVVAGRILELGTLDDG